MEISINKLGTIIIQKTHKLKGNRLKVWFKYPNKTEINHFITADKKLQEELTQLELPQLGNIYRITNNYSFEVIDIQKESI